MKKFLMLVLLMFAISNCVKEGKICLYEIEITNSLPPIKSFRSYKIETQYRYCTLGSGGGGSSGNAHHSGFTSQVIRLKKEYENTPANLLEVDKDFQNFLDQEEKRGCFINQENKKKVADK